MATTVALRPMTRADLPLLARWLRARHVEVWFPWEHGAVEPLEAVAAEYGPCLEGLDPTELFVVSESGQPVGFVQRYAIADNPEWERALAPVVDTTAAYGIDYAIGELTAVGRGVGTEAIRQLVADTFARYSGVRSIVVAVQQANVASWRALEKSGFGRRWAGLLDSPDPSDAGPSYVYAVDRPVVSEP